MTSTLCIYNHSNEIHTSFVMENTTAAFCFWHFEGNGRWFSWWIIKNVVPITWWCFTLRCRNANSCLIISFNLMLKIFYGLAELVFFCTAGQWQRKWSSTLSATSASCSASVATASIFWQHSMHICYRWITFVVIKLLIQCHKVDCS